MLKSPERSRNSDSFLNDKFETNQLGENEGLELVSMQTTDCKRSTSLDELISKWLFKSFYYHCVSLSY